MDSRRNKLLATSLALLLVLSAALAWWNRREERIGVNPDAFAVHETEKISRVLLIRPSDTVELAFNGTRWLVNGTWEADVQMIKVLMATLRQVEPHRPVAAILADTVNARLTRQGTRVVLTLSDATQRAFYAGGNAAKSEAWFRNEGEQQPYVIIIPGYRVYVSGVFELDALGWRNKRIFDFNWRNFKSLTASYPADPSAGFSVEMRQRYFGISGLEAVDTTKLNDYLDAVSLLLARRFVARNDATIDGILREKPMVRIEIHDIADRTYSLELFAPRTGDTEVLGRLADGQVVTFDREDATGLMRRKAWFEQKGQ